MNQLLEPGQVVRTEMANQPCTVEQFLGGGGQGEVYRVNLGGTPLALKWLYPASATGEQEQLLRTLIRRGAPTDRFLWPLDLTTASGVPAFGYLMPLLDPTYRSFHQLVSRRVDATFRAVTTVGIELAQNYLQLHARGWCYRDVSWNNVFFEPDTGTVVIGDNDNVTVNGDPHVTVAGTPRFMAPEIVRGTAVPSTQTDLHSLAVLLFYVLFVSSPFEGKREHQVHSLDRPALVRLYGTEPVFIFDPNDDSNRPVPGVHDNAVIFWSLYPTFIRDLFTQAFTRGLADPQARVVETEWRQVLTRLRDAIFCCMECGAETFYDAEAVRASGGAAGRCWNPECRAELAVPPRLRLGRHLVMLNPASQLFPHHMDEGKLYVFSPTVAQVVQHPSDARIWGLQNTSESTWTAIGPDGSSREVAPRQSVRLLGGLRIHFGSTTGQVEI